MKNPFKKRPGSKCGGNCELMWPHDGIKHGYVSKVIRTWGKVTGHAISHWGKGRIPELHEIAFPGMDIEDQAA